MTKLHFRPKNSFFKVVCGRSTLVQTHSRWSPKCFLLHQMTVSTDCRLFISAQWRFKKKNLWLRGLFIYKSALSELIACFFFWFGWVFLFYFFHPLSPWTQLSWANPSIDEGGKGLEFPHVSNKTAQWCIFSNRIHLIWGDTFCKICGHQSTMCYTLLVSSCCALMIIQLPVFVKAIVDFQAFPNNLMK